MFLTFMMLNTGNIANAQENDIAKLNHLPIFENKDTNLEEIQLPTAPNCNTLQLFEKVVQTAKKYISELNSDSIINKRKAALLISNLKNFEQVNTQDIEPETNYEIANALITIKVNKHLKNDDITLCKQTGKIKDPLYLIIYPYMDNYMVHIINLDNHSVDYEKISFTYP